MQDTVTTIQKVSHEVIQKLLDVQNGPCVSLYMPTHQSHPDNAQDPIRFQNLLKELESSLLMKYDKATTKEHLAPLEKLSQDASFWNHTTKGLAVFSAEDFFEVVTLQETTAELAMVADSFHTKPLRQYIQSMDRFHVLGLSINGVKLYEGNHRNLIEIELDATIPTNMVEALGDDLTDKHLTVASYGGAGSQSANMHHGHGGKKEEMNNDTERYFRVVAQEIYEKYSKPTGWPLILTALSEHHSLFQKVSKNPHLLHRGIKFNPAAITIDNLKEKAWEIMEPEYMEKMEQVIEKYELAKSGSKSSDNIKEVAVAAVEGRVDTLLIDSDRVIAMRITNLTTGNTQNKDITNPKVDDLLDDMSELVTKMGGAVVVLPADQMPTDTGLAAIFRY